MLRAGARFFEQSLRCADQLFRHHFLEPRSPLDAVTSAEGWIATFVDCSGRCEDHPRDPGYFRCESDGDLVNVHSRLPPVQPRAQSVSRSIDVNDTASCAMYQHPAQVAVSALADAEKGGLPACRVLSRHKSQPRSHVPSLSEL